MSVEVFFLSVEISGNFYVLLTEETSPGYSGAKTSCENIAVSHGQYDLIEFETSQELNDVHSYLATRPGMKHSLYMSSTH